ncbi:membrane protease YdiL (CAAX protease family) [Bacillus ectoiniformans]|uniref:CPBP family intramembrane glutamic endopeptidase n=1 Tax=Bacillus ectoiniformans TaxID=1494429 RepID=UPI001EF7897C|nr:type II CAAX endopeptidase family protein [Bacillus ectoiniformans]MBM7648229.1 membrane protease YdiL (CAAX protease family) [Bacillus ectoiniformans]
MEKAVSGNKPFYEMLLLVIMMVAAAFFFPKLLGIVSIIPILYFFIENKARKHSIKEPVFKHKDIVQDLKTTWIPFVTVAFFLQFIYFWLFTNFSPELITQVKERTSFITSFDTKIVLTLLILALGEEIVFRGLIQKRLNWKLSAFPSILMTSFVFALLHISDGTPVTVTMDLSTVFIDSVFFGYLFYKTQNLYISWLAHALGNITAAFLLIYFI